MRFKGEKKAHFIGLSLPISSVSGSSWGTRELNMPTHKRVCGPYHNTESHSLQYWDSSDPGSNTK